MFKINKVLMLNWHVYFIYYKNIYYLYWKKNNKIILLPISNYLVNNTFFTFFNTDLYLQYSNFLHYFKYLVYSWEKFIVQKLRFSYKGSWVFMNKLGVLNLVFEFGQSHRFMLFLYDMKLIRKKKLLEANSLIFWGINISKLEKLLDLMYLISKFNCYTLRGIRFSQQAYYSSVGKVSKYSMFKSKIF